LSGRAARSQNYRSAIASADSFDRYYRLPDYQFLHYCPNPKWKDNGQLPLENFPSDIPAWPYPARLELGVGLVWLG